jgi:hypothetical protein
MNDAKRYKLLHGPYRREGLSDDRLFDPKTDQGID